MSEVLNLKIVDIVFSILPTENIKGFSGQEPDFILTGKRQSLWLLSPLRFALGLVHSPCDDTLIMQGYIISC